MKRSFVPLLIASSLCGCFGPESERYEGAGVSFIVPLEDSRTGIRVATYSLTELEYANSSFRASVSGNRLSVSDRGLGSVSKGVVITFLDYGPLSKGDEVDFLGWPEVKVNGQIRQPGSK